MVTGSSARWVVGLISLALINCAGDSSENPFGIGNSDSDTGASSVTNGDLPPTISAGMTVAETEAGSASAEGDTAADSSDGSQTSGIGGTSMSAGESSDGDSSGTGAYGQVDEDAFERLTTHHRDVALPEVPHRAAIEFVWSPEQGWPAAADLGLQYDDSRDPLVQVFTREKAPYARIGLVVTPLRADTPYEIVLSWLSKGGATASIVGEDGTTLVSAQVDAGGHGSNLVLVTPHSDLSAAPVSLGAIHVQ